MTKQRIYLFDTTLRYPFAHSCAASEDEQSSNSRRADEGMDHGG